MLNGVSVIICCYNSAQVLPEALKYIAGQEVPQRFPWEVIVVDNASLDTTADVAKKEWKKYNLEVPIKVVAQPINGLSFARQKGIESATYNYLVFCDDDNWLSKSYIFKSFQILNKNPTIGAVGGKGISTRGMPGWLKDFEGFYAIGEQGKDFGDVTETSGVLFGAGMVVRKDAIFAIQSHGFQSLLSGRSEKKLLSGEDLELTYALRISGYRLFYDPELVFYHDLKPSRFTIKYFVRLVFYIGYSWMSLMPYHQVLYSLKLKFPFPNHKDALFLLQRVGKHLFKFGIALISFQFAVAKKNGVQLVFVLGQLWFVKERYRVYKSPPKFLQKK